MLGSLKAMQDIVQSNSSTLHRAEVILSSEREYAGYLDSCMFLGSVTLLCSSIVCCSFAVSYFTIHFMVCTTLT